MFRNLSFAFVGFSLLLVSFASASTLDRTYKDFRFKKAVSLPAISAPQYVQLPLDTEVLGSDARDLRLYDSSGREVSYQSVMHTKGTKSRAIEAKLYDLGERAGETLFVLDLGAEPVSHNGLSLMTDATSFRRPLSIYVSEQMLGLDDARWRAVTTSGYVARAVDAKAGFDAGQVSVTYPDSTARYLRVIVGKGDGQIVVRGASVFAKTEESGASSMLTFQSSIEQNVNERATELHFDMGDSVPTNRVVLSLGETLKAQDFHRRAVVSVSDDNLSWRVVGQGYLYAVNLPTVSRSSLDIDYPEIVARYLRVVVMNDDNAPVIWGKTASFESVSRSLVFKAYPDSVYTLYYGNPEATFPNYDVGQIFDFISAGDLPKASLGTAEANQDYVAPTPTKPPFSESHPQVLGGALALLVIVIGALVARSFVRAKVK